MRELLIWDAGFEQPLVGFAVDQAMAAATVERPERALVRVWQRAVPGLSAGRYHRLPPGSVGLQRRLSGGRIVPVGPGVIGITLVVADAQWLSPAGPLLRPEQVLNRALRPLLRALRSCGVDAFYPGRDVVTAAGQALAYASFCVFPDGVVSIEQMLATETSFADVETEIGHLDPTGVAAIELRAFAGATTLAVLRETLTWSDLRTRLVQACAETLSCGSSFLDQPPLDVERAVCVNEAAYAAFQAERGAQAPDRTTGATFGVLGAVEVSASIADDRVRDLEISGDLIAPFATLERIASACENLPAQPATLRSTVARVLAEPDRFVLGVTDLPETVARLVY